jgi:hypothetical protein
MTPIDIHWAIGRLLEDVGNREDVGNDLEHAWSLIQEWWTEESVGNKPSGIYPYPEEDSPEDLNGWYCEMGWCAA